MNRRVVGLSLLLLCLEAKAAVQVVYVNGASAPVDGIAAQAKAIVDSLISNGVPSDYKFGHFPIAQTEFQSASAIVCQREFSRECFPTADSRPTQAAIGQYLLSLGQRYQNFATNMLLNPAFCPFNSGTGKLGAYTDNLASVIGTLAAGDDTIILVGYSQGNNYIEGAVALAYARGDLVNLDRVKVVGIGSPAFTSLGDRYVNGAQDRVVYGTVLGSDASLPASYTFCVDDCSRAGTETELVDASNRLFPARNFDNFHYLEPFYLNPFIQSVEWRESIPRSIAREVTSAAAPSVVRQPSESKDIWTTSVYSNAPGGGGPGGGQNNEELRIGGWGDEYRSLVSFNLTGLPATASSATIELYQPATPFLSSASNTRIFVDRITAFWDWRTQGTGADRERLWWADRPTATPESGPLAAPARGTWYSIDITTLYNDWKSGAQPNYGIMLRPESTNNNWAIFYSADYAGDPSLRPKLVVTPGTLPPPPAFVTFTASGQINDIGNGGGALGEWFPVVPTVGDYFTVEYTFDTSTTDSEPAPGSATYLGSISEISLIVGSNPPVTISAQNLTTNRTKITAAGSPCFYEILVGGLGATGRDFSYSFNLSGGPTGCMPETLPTEPPYVPTFSSAPFGFGAVNRAGGLDNIGGAISEITQNLGQL